MPKKQQRPPKIVPNLSGETVNYLVRRGNKTIARCPTEKVASEFIASLEQPVRAAAPKRAKRKRRTTKKKK